MLIDIVAVGSRGDVQPYIALALGLRTAGYRVRMVTMGGFEDLVGGFGLEHLAIGDAPQEIAKTSAGRDWVQHRTSAAGFLRGFVRLADSLIEDGLARYWNASHETGAMIVSPMGLLVGGHIAERLGVPMIRSQFAAPVLPTRYGWDGRRNLRTAVSGRLNPSIHAAFHFLIWSKLRRSTNIARRTVLGLGPLSLMAPHSKKDQESQPLLCAYSPAVLPRLPDWSETIQVTGYWFLDDVRAWTPSRELLDFLASGPPPVFIGFGSTPFPNPKDTTDLVVRAVARAGHRGILLAGGSGLSTGQLSRDVLSVDSVPHGWLFSRVCAAVHHGGAGVTGAALRAGLPSVVVPVFADQPFWGNQVFRLGVGPRPIPAQRLTEDKLASAIQATAGKTMRDRAREIGNQICKEQGVVRAVEIINKHLGNAAFAARNQYAH